MQMHAKNKILKRQKYFKGMIEFQNLIQGYWYQKRVWKYAC